MSACAGAEDEPLDREAAEQALAELAEQVNAGQKEKSVDEVSIIGRRHQLMCSRIAIIVTLCLPVADAMKPVRQD